MRPHPLSLLLLLVLAFTACSTESPSFTSATSASPTEFVLISLVAGDVACYVTLRSAEGVETEALGGFEICENTGLIGRSVRLTFGEGQVLADSCAGDPECRDSKTVQLIQTMEGVDFNPPTASATPAFAGQVGHLDKAQALYDVLQKNDGGIVDLDLELTVDTFQDEAGTFFALWVQCDDLPPGESPSAEACWGIEVQAHGVFDPLGTPPRLHGRFRVQGFDGPHQGLFAVPLELLVGSSDS